MTDTTYLLDNYVATKAGQAYRLFPFGKIVKNGKTREITPETASQFRLPHFKPAIKLGSHDDPTPAGGFIVALEVRDDGLYAIPEWNEVGDKAMQDGAYRYHSPEIIWGDGAIENPAGQGQPRGARGPEEGDDADEGERLRSPRRIEPIERFSKSAKTAPTAVAAMYGAPCVTRA